MTRTKAALAALGLIGVAAGVVACEDDDVVSIETPDGEISMEEDGDIDIDD